MKIPSASGDFHPRVEGKLVHGPFLALFLGFGYDEGKTNERGISMYDKHLYVFDGNTPREAVIRNYTTDDFADLIRVQQESLEDEEIEEE